MREVQMREVQMGVSRMDNDQSDSIDDSNAETGKERKRNGLSMNVCKFIGHNLSGLLQIAAGHITSAQVP